MAEQHGGFTPYQKEMVEHLTELQVAVKKLWDLYELHPELDDYYDIQSITPMSLDDWWHEIQGKLEGLRIEMPSVEMTRKEWDTVHNIFCAMMYDEDWTEDGQHLNNPEDEAIRAKLDEAAKCP